MKQDRSGKMNLINPIYFIAINDSLRCYAVLTLAQEYRKYNTWLIVLSYSRERSSLMISKSNKITHYTLHRIN